MIRMIVHYRHHKSRISRVSFQLMRLGLESPDLHFFNISDPYLYSPVIFVVVSCNDFVETRSIRIRNVCPVCVVAAPLPLDRIISILVSVQHRDEGDHLAQGGFHVVPGIVDVNRAFGIALVLHGVRHHRVRGKRIAVSVEDQVFFLIPQVGFRSFLAFWNDRDRVSVLVQDQFAVFIPLVIILRSDFSVVDSLGGVIVFNLYDFFAGVLFGCFFSCIFSVLSRNFFFCIRFAVFSGNPFFSFNRGLGFFAGGFGFFRFAFFSRQGRLFFRNSCRK